MNYTEENKKNNIKLLIGTPAYGGNLHYQYTTSLIILTEYLKKNNISYHIYFIGNESLITRARSIIVGKFLSDEEYTHLFFIDADIGFSIDNFIKLWNAKKDVCVGIYPSKTFIFNNTKKHVENGANANDLESLSLNYMLNYDKNSDNKIIIDSEKKLIKLRYGTTGFMLIKKEVILKLLEKYPDKVFYNNTLQNQHKVKPGYLTTFFDTMIHPIHKDYLSEDYTFCYLWRQIGGEVWGIYESKLSHYGTYEFKGDLLKYFKYQ